MRVKFTKDYDYTYPSRAMQFFPKGTEMTIKRVIGDAAIDAGCAEEVTPEAGDPDPDAPEVVHDVTVHDIPPEATA